MIVHLYISAAVNMLYVVIIIADRGNIIIFLVYYKCNIIDVSKKHKENDMCVTSAGEINTMRCQLLSYVQDL